MVTTIFGLIKTRQGKVAGHARWLRVTKQAAYAEFLSAIVEASNTLVPAAAAKESQRRSSIAISQIQLLVPIRHGSSRFAQRSRPRHTGKAAVP